MSNNKFDSDYLKWLQQIDVSGADPIWEELEDRLDLIESWDKIHAKLDIIQPEEKIGLISRNKVMEIAATIAFLIFIPLIIYLVQPKEETPAPADQLLTETPAPKAIPDNDEIFNDNNEVNNLPLKKTSDLSIAEKTLIPEKELPPQEEKLSSIAETTLPIIKKGISDEETELRSDKQPSGEMTFFTPEERFGTTAVTHLQTDKTIISDDRIIDPSNETNDFPSQTDPSSPERLTIIPERTGMKKPDKFAEMPVIKQLLPEINIIPEKTYDEIPKFIVTTNTYTAKLKNSAGSFLRFHNIGLVYSFKNTWLLNYETRNGLNPIKLGNTLPTFHHDMGITTRLVLKNKHDIGLEFMWISGTGQDYEQYINASYVNRSIILNYFKFQSLYLWNHRKIPGNMITGAYFGILSTAEDIQGDVKFNVMNDYRNYDYGLVLGYQFNVPLFNNIILCPGVRFNLNLINIFEGHEGAINIFKTTNNFTSGINILVNYSF